MKRRNYTRIKKVDRDKGTAVGQAKNPLEGEKG